MTSSALQWVLVQARTLWTGVDDAVPDARSLVISIRIDARAVRGTLQKVMPGDEYPLAHGFPVVSIEGVRYIPE